MADANLDDLLAALREVSENSDPADEEDDDDQVSDFRKRKPIGTVMLLERLEQQAELKTDQDRSLAARRLRIKPPPTKLQQKNGKLTEIRRKAAEAEHELRLNQQLEVETLRLQKARVELYKENLTSRDRMELETNSANMAAWAAQFCKEAGSNWQEEARAAFGSQYQPPVNGQVQKRS